MTAANIERIIRPALLTSIAPPRRQLETQEKAVEKVELLFGGPGQGVYTVNLTNYRGGYETVEKTKETQRSFDVVRVHNPDDHEQYVDMESVKSVIMQGRDGKKREAIYQPFKEDPHNIIQKKDQVRKNPDQNLPVG